MATKGRGRKKIEPAEVLGKDIVPGDVAGVPKAAEELPEAVSVAEGEKITEIPPSSAQEALWTIGTWRGRTQWQCRQCAWDTLEGEAKMLAHIKAAHRPPPSPILIADKRGKQIN